MESFVRPGRDRDDENPEIDIVMPKPKTPLARVSHLLDCDKIRERNIWKMNKSVL